MIVGEGPERPALERRIADDGLAVRLLGHRDELGSLLAAADLALLTSTWEARALVAQEALLAGLPLISTRVGGIEELVGDAAVLVELGRRGRRRRGSCAGWPTIPDERARLRRGRPAAGGDLAGRGRGGRGPAGGVRGRPGPAMKAEGEPGSVPMIRPPRLHLGREGTASRLELFFDLAYVLVIMQLAIAFVDDLSWLGLAQLTGLFVAIWFSWVGFTLYANRFDTDDLIFRLAKLLATGAIAGCAASAADAVGSKAVPFALCYLASRLILLGLYVRAWRHVPDARPTINVYLIVIGLSSVLWAISDRHPGRRSGTCSGGSRSPSTPSARRWPRSAATSSRCTSSTCRSVSPCWSSWSSARRSAAGSGACTSRGGPAPGVAVAAIGFVLAGAMWWIYFDIGARDSADELEEAEEESEPEKEAVDERHDLFVYGHLPTTFGVVLAGVGIEELVLHPDEPLPSAYGWLLAVGIGLFLGGVAMILGGTQRSWRAVWPWPLAAVPLVPVIALLPTSALLLTGGYAVLLVALAIGGTRAESATEEFRRGIRRGGG